MVCQLGVSFMGTAWDEVNLLNIAYSFEQENKFFPKTLKKLIKRLNARIYS